MTYTGRVGALPDFLYECTDFEWDHGNVEKIHQKHDVRPDECEQVFQNEPLIIADDIKHSQQETRFFALGQTDERRWLFIVFTVRAHKIRVISARDMHKKERIIYEKAVAEIQK